MNNACGEHGGKSHALLRKRRKLYVFVSFRGGDDTSPPEESKWGRAWVRNAILVRKAFGGRREQKAVFE